MDLEGKSMAKWADMIENETLDDDDNLWYPTESLTKDPSTQLQLKFLNRNINYRYMPNMVSLAANREQKYNPYFPVAVKFCQRVKTVNQLTGPFGQMIIWRLPPGKVIPAHKNQFEYHKNVIRSMFILTPNTTGLFRTTINGSNINCNRGELFQFDPFNDIQYFENGTSENFHFLTFDNWYKTKLNDAIDNMDPREWLGQNPERRGYALKPEFSQMLYISAH
jgi:hypothetical protein